MRMGASAAQTAEFLLERPQPAPLLLPDAERLADLTTTVDGASATIDATMQGMTSVHVVHAGALMVVRCSATHSRG